MTANVIDFRPRGACSSNQVRTARNATGAIKASRAGRAGLAGGPRNPTLEASLYAIEARGFAALRESGEAARRLALAEEAMEVTRGAPLSEWVSMFDEGTLAAEAARLSPALRDHLILHRSFPSARALVGLP